MIRDYNILAQVFPILALRRKYRPDPVVMAARGRSGAAMRKVKALLAQYPQITVEKDSLGDYWIFCDAFDPTTEADPLHDQHFAVGGEEVLEAVNVYVEALKAKA